MSFLALQQSLSSKKKGSTPLHKQATSSAASSNAPVPSMVPSGVLPLQQVRRLCADVHTGGVTGERPPPQLIRHFLRRRLDVGGGTAPGWAQVVVQKLALCGKLSTQVS